MNRTETSRWGRKNHVAYPCDDYENGRCVRSWDIYRHGSVVESGLRTRRAARDRAEARDRQEAIEAIRRQERPTVNEYCGYEYHCVRADDFYVEPVEPPRHYFFRAEDAEDAIEMMREAFPDDVHGFRCEREPTD